MVFDEYLYLCFLSTQNMSYQLVRAQAIALDTVLNKHIVFQGLRKNKTVSSSLHTKCVVPELSE